MTRTVEMRLVKEVTNELLQDILVTAFDSVYGGCLYWTRSHGWINDKEVHVAYDDPEDDRILNCIVDPDLIVRGIQIILASDASSINNKYVGMVERAVIDDDAGDIDADVADVIVQMGIFGKVVFS